MQTNPFDPTETFEGRLRGKQVPDGSCDARLTVSMQGIQATPSAGPAHLLPLEGLKVRRDESQALIATQADGKWSVSCDDPNFLRALETVAGNHLNDQLARLEGQSVSSRGKHLLGCFLVLAFCGLLLWSIPRLFHRAVQGSVAALPTSVDVALGEAAQDSMDPGGPIVEDEVILAAMQAMVDRLAEHASMEGIEYQVRVVESSIANAYALPGGFITVFTGLIAESETPEQVAGVLAHEIAHVTERHGLRRVAHQVGLMASVSLLFGNLGGLEKIAIDLFTLQQVNGYSQEQETDADLEGLKLLIAAEIDPTGLSEFFEIMEAEYGDVPDSLAWASSHPQFKQRIATIEEALAASEHPQYWAPIDVDWEAVQLAVDEL